MDAAGKDTAGADEGVPVGQAGCVAGKLERCSSALRLTLFSMLQIFPLPAENPHTLRPCVA